MPDVVQNELHKNRMVRFHVTAHAHQIVAPCGGPRAGNLPEMPGSSHHDKASTSHLAQRFQDRIGGDPQHSSERRVKLEDYKDRGRNRQCTES